MCAIGFPSFIDASSDCRRLRSSIEGGWKNLAYGFSTDLQLKNKRAFMPLREQR